MSSGIEVCWRSYSSSKSSPRLVLRATRNCWLAVRASVLGLLVSYHILRICIVLK
ncbi:hypothetical protein DAEQUDRAFT_34724 [Daedalea quercina L-15889]|uniref:Uncharacterized protein n=1 Tax=Daedalea quercina L-15889 TaxID=1314783 RepID=A0A165SS80_9APHY|nr:hypothetical protein DAEQUDRAFT_34724 [Daedalea quercina L-15889]